MIEHVFVSETGVEPTHTEQPAVEALSAEDLADEIKSLAAHLDAAKARWLALVAEFTRRGLYAEWGARTPAEWVSWQCGLAPGAAREQVRVATRLEDLPAVGEAFAAGQLSYSKVRALTRLDTIEDEAAIVELARTHTASQLERVVRATRRVTREEAGRIHDERSLALIDQEDGSVLVRGVLAGEEAAVLRRALESAMEVLRERADDGGDDSPSRAAPVAPYEVRMADALVLLADTTLAKGPRPRTPPQRHEVVIHVDADSCAADDGTPLAPAVVERLCCDAGIVVSLERGGEPLAAAPRTRTIPSAVRRALHRRDGGCRFPGCRARRWVDAHHIRHWAHGGPNTLDNLVLLCHHHHKLLHEGGYGLVREGDRLIFMNEHGHTLDEVTGEHTGSTRALVEGNGSHGATPTSSTLVDRQTGQSLNLDLSVLAFLRRSRGNT